MKKTVLICLAVILAISANTQVTRAQDQSTTLYVGITVERQETVAGPYARYSQKYLGVAAPLTDRVSYGVTSAEILDTGAMPLRGGIAAPGTAYTHMNPAEGFPRLTVDRTSAATPGLEESARLAAETIFGIRKSRIDLITGEVGENVFGGGLAAALDELGRLEEEYLSLFLGRQTVGTDLRHYRIIPIKGRLTYTVCRFSETDGLLPDDDLSGMPVVLELRPTADPLPAVSDSRGKPASRAIPQTVPADMRCRIIFDGVELASQQFRIWQLGETVYVTQ